MDLLLQGTICITQIIDLRLQTGVIRLQIRNLRIQRHNILGVVSYLDLHCRILGLESNNCRFIGRDSIVKAVYVADERIHLILQ